MKKLIRRFCALLLTFLYIVTIGSLISHHGNDHSISMTIHKAAGMLMLLVLCVHLVNHSEWFKAVLLQPSVRLNRKLQHRRRSMLIMIVCTFICGFSGLFTMVLSEESELITHLHAISGFILIVTMGIHLYHMHSWFIKEIRHFLQSRQDEKLPVVYFENPKE